GVKQPVAIEPRRKHGNPPLEIKIDGDPGRTGVPEVAEVVLKGVAMSGTRHKSSRLIGDRIVWGIGEWSERTLADTGAVRIDIVLRAGPRVLQVVFALVFGHPRAFDKGFDRVPMI